MNSLMDPPQKQVDNAVMDYFMIEMVNTLRSSAAIATARAKRLEQEMIEAGLVPQPTPAPPPLPLKKESARDSVTSLASKSGSVAGKAALDEDEEAIRVRLEAIGTHVGANITEKLCRDRGMFVDTLDVIKFICKDIWAVFWDKQVDNLRTNHRGIYVLQDNQFKPITRASSWEGRAEAIRRARIYAAVPTGVIRGALSRLGYNSTVTPEIISLPQCTFQIKLPKNT